MNVNYFFLVATAGLLSIFVLFRPMDIERTQHTEIALLDMENFSVYELGQTGLKSIMKGSSGERFNNRYEVRDVNFTDNTKAYIQNMRSDFALYDEENLYLQYNVKYERADGLTFSSDEALYQQKLGVARTDGRFVIVQGSDKVTGSQLRYDTAGGKIRAKRVKATFSMNNRKDNQ